MFATRRLLPESVVWLYARNRVAEAEQVIRNAAKLNNITMPDKILVQPEITLTEDGEESDDDSGRKCEKSPKTIRKQSNLRKSENTEDRSTRYTILDIFRNRHLTIYIFCMVFLWSVKSFTLEVCRYVEIIAILSASSVPALESWRPHV